MANFLDLLKNVADIGYQAQTGGLRISVKTNLGPEFDLWDGSKGRRGSLAQFLGIKGALIIRDRDGKVLMIHGEPPPTNPLLAAALVGGVSYIGYLAWRGATRRR